MTDLSRLADPSLEQRSVNALRVLAMDAVQRAESGHPGLPLGAADMAYVLWSKFLRFDPEAPDWFNRDRFVLSGGHGCMLQYALLHLMGFDLSLDEIMNFRQWGSRTPGHPEYGHTPGVDTTTGPLGQGIATAVGMAAGERRLGALLNSGKRRPVDFRTYVLATDGDMMEGVQSEAASLAGHWGLGKLNVLYDSNSITIDGSTDLAFTEDVGARYQAYGWGVLHVDGHDREAVAQALDSAVAEEERPTLIVARTHIALGSPNKQGSAESHGSPLGQDEVKATKKVYGWPTEPSFYVPEDVREHYGTLGRRHRDERTTWESAVAQARKDDRDFDTLWGQWENPPRLSKDNKPAFEPGDSVATRAASGKALAWVCGQDPFTWGGSADLAPSNKTLLDNNKPFSREHPEGRNLHFGVREHAMAAILNGLALLKLRPYGGTFLVFSDYLRPSLRLSALMDLPVVYVFTHDSIFLGEDGPTHQPVGQIPALRAIPNLTVIRPADAQETVEAWEVARERSGPTALVLTRQGLPGLPPERRGELRRGAYVAHRGGDRPRAIVFATGSEVNTALQAVDAVDADVRVVAVPSWELLAEQPQDYRNAILSPEIEIRLAVEAASPLGWERFVGIDGHVHGMTRFGASAPAGDLGKHFGFTPEGVAGRLRELLG